MAATKAAAKKPATRKKAPARKAVKPTQAPEQKPASSHGDEPMGLTHSGEAPSAVPASDNTSALSALDKVLSEEEHAEQAEREHEEAANGPSPEEQAEMREMREAGARAMAAYLTGGAATGVQMLFGVEVPKDQCEQFEDKLAPVLAKNGGGMPEWLLPYREEFELGMCTAGIAFGLWLQVQARKREEAERQAQQRQQAQGHQPRPSQPARADSLDPNAPEE